MLWELACRVCARPMPKIYDSFFIPLIALILMTSMSSARAEDTPQAVKHCLDCHGVEGLRKNPRAPILMRQGRQYLEHQLNAFLRGNVRGKGPEISHDRKDLVMSRQAHEIDKADITVMVDYFAAQACVGTVDIDSPAPQPRPIPQYARRCFVCHGYEGRSHIAFVPRLTGQRKDYLDRQMNAFLNGRSQTPASPGHSRNHQIMDHQGGYLNAAEVDRITTYFANLPCR